MIGAKSRTKTAVVCLADNSSNLAALDENQAYLLTANMDVYNCADFGTGGVINAGAVPIGEIG